MDKSATRPANSLRLIIIGNGGTGKSTLGNKLSNDMNVPVMHLDKLVWRDNYEVIPESEFRMQLMQLFEKDRIILEGWSNQYTMRDRIKWADVIIYLKYPLDNCLNTVLNRNKEYSGRSYPYDNFTGDRVARNDLYIKAVKRVHYEHEPETQKWLEEQAGGNKTIITYSSFEELNRQYEELLTMLKGL